jgi:hypothetical protein
VRIALALLAALVLAGAVSAAAPPTAPLVTFPGLDSTNLPGVNPADVQLAAGPGTLVQTVNTAIAIWTTGGATPQLVRSQQLGAFFSNASTNRAGDAMTDPRIIYDNVSGRFFAAVFDITRVELDVAVSATSDPNGAWTIYPLPSSGCPDQPRLGTSDAVVVVTDDQFSSCRGRGVFLGGEVNVLSKQDLLAGSPSPRRSHFGPDNRFAAITPAQSLGTTPTDYLVAVEQSGATIQLLHIDSPDISSVAFTTVALAAAIGNPPEARQRSGVETVDVGDNRAQNAFFEGGKVWLTASEQCPGSDGACARIVELSTGGKVLLDQTLALPNGRSLFYPAIAPDERGNVVVCFGYASANDDPSLGYAYLRPDGTVSAPFDVAVGTSPNDSGRFGDYSGAARDPGDPSKVWIAGEIGNGAGGALGWGSTVAAVRVPPQPPAARGITAVARGAGGASFSAELFTEAAATRYHFEYGPTKAYGSSTPIASLAASVRSQVVTANAAGIQPGSRAHARLVASNATGEATSADVLVAIPAAAPLVTYPAQATSRSGAAVTLRALVSARGAATTVVFEYGTTRAYGRRATAHVGGAGRGLVVVRVAGLKPGATYHFRAVATNAKGRATGADRTFRA